VAAYAIGLAFFRGVLHSGSMIVRLVIAVLALPTIWLGIRFTPVPQIAALVVILVAGIAADAAPSRP
jgi:hypothetical protein